MNNSNRLLEIYKQKLSLTSNTAVGERLGMKQQTVSMWVHNKSHPNAEAIEAMCKATGEKLEHWLPLIEADRSRTAGDRRAWLRLAQAAASVALAVIAYHIEPHSSAILSLSPLYIMRNFGRCDGVCGASLPRASGSFDTPA